MNGIFKYFSAAALMLFSLGAVAQNTALLDQMCENTASSCIEISYSYSTEISGVNTLGGGIVKVQGRMWHMEGNGIEMWCDSTTVWIVDEESKEVVIEPATDEASGETVNPAVLFVRLKELFDVQSARTTADGRAVLYILSAKRKSAIEYCNVEILKENATIRSGAFLLADGSKVKVDVGAMTTSPECSPQSFRPQIDFDTSWIVTDLR